MAVEWHIHIEGRVQGIGFRAAIFRLARLKNIFGYVRNLPDGSVEICAQGSEEVLQAFVDAIRKRPGLAVIDHLLIEKRKIRRPLDSFLVAD